MDEMRMINANSLRGRIQERIQELNKEVFVESSDMSNLLDDMLDYIDTEPTIDPESPWREASNPPPITDVKEWDDEHGHHRYATSDKVWIYCETGRMMYGKYDEVGGYFADNGLYIGRWYGLRVTHWMPLPEPPKGVA